MSSKKLLALLCVAAAAVSVQAATNYPAGNITSDQTWQTGDTYVLTNRTYVTDGATLTIEEGVVVRGQPSAGDNVGALLVTRGSKLRILGTHTNPVVMTNMEDDRVFGNPGTAPYNALNNGITETWGGLLMLGRTYIAKNKDGDVSPDASITLQIEGTEPDGALGFYGGGDDDDDSGEIRFLSIRYGGYVLGTDNEINGLTLGAVGRGTDISHVEIFNTKDDGVEWFAGTVNTKYMLVWMCGDDSFDWDEGFRGKGQFWVSVQGPLSSQNDKSDKGAECDGAMGDSGYPSAAPTIYNATFVGHGIDSANGDTKNTALHLRDGTGGRFYNSLFLDFAGAPTLIEGLPDGSAFNNAFYGDKYDAADNMVTPYVKNAYYTHDDHNGGSSKMLELTHNIFAGFLYTNAFGCVGEADQVPSLAGPYGAEHKPGDGKYDGNKAHYGKDTGFNLYDAAFANAYYDRAGTDPFYYTDIIDGLSRDTTAVVIGGKNYYPVNVLYPTLPAGSPALTSDITPPNDGFYSQVSFKGAFDENTLWTAGWTLAHSLGGFGAADASVEYGTFTEPPTVVFSDQVYAIVFETEDDGKDYVVETATDIGATTWTTNATFVGDGSTITNYVLQEFTDTRVYRVVIKD
jgi:hypothetical protein